MNFLHKNALSDIAKLVAKV